LSHRNKRSKTGPSKTTVVNVSADQLELQARQALSVSQYKLAIQHLKALLKQGEVSVQVNALLQEAYTGRAEQLAAQGMIKEAAVIWEVAIPHGLDLADPRYIGWLVKSRQYPRLLDVYRKIPTENRQPLQPTLAAAVLSGTTPLLASLPDEDPVRTGYGPALQLLEAWCAGEDAEHLHELMKAIPFRSPYRDLRQVIQSWLLLETSPEQVTSSLERIAPNSPFRPLAEQVQLAQMDALEVLPQLSALSPAARAYHLEVRGWSDPGCTILLKKLEALTNEPSADKLFAFLAQLNFLHSPPHIQAWLRDITKKAWVVSYTGQSPQRHFQHLEKVIGQPSQLEKLHLISLICIVSSYNIEELSYAWGNYGDALLASDMATVNKTDSVCDVDRLLAVAEINRYVAAKWKDYDPLQTGKEGTAVFIQLLRLSLRHDPGAQAVWAEVVEYYLQSQKLADTRTILQEALEHHPDVIALLELGIRLAVAGSAFKKAATYAKRILELDPINTRVRKHLQNAHIAHARKQIKQKKYHLARKELAEAQQWKSSPLNDTILQVLQASLDHLDEQNEDRDAVNAIFQRLAKVQDVHPVGLDFIFRHESILTGFAPRVLWQVAGYDDPWKKPEREGVMAVMDTARQLMDSNPDTVTAPLDSLLFSLKKAARLKFSVSEGERLCEFWMQVKQNELLRLYACALEKAWPKKPVFTYYRFVNANPFDVTVIPSLKAAWEEAHVQGDLAVSSRLGGLLDRFSNPYRDFDELDFDDDFDDEFEDISGEELAAEISQLAEMIPVLPFKEVFECVCDFIGKAKASLILKRQGEVVVRELCKKCLRNDVTDKYIDLLLSDGPQEKREVKKKSIQGRLF
jgi:tetratricopeptide (TPR) repeat protein